MSLRRTLHLLLAAIVIVLLSPGPTPAQGQERAPTELWKEFPLDPRSVRTNADPQESPASTGAQPVRRVQVRETGAEAAQNTAEDDRSSWLVLLSLGLIAAGVLGVAIRALQILSAFRDRRRPTRSPLREFRSETGSLVPHAPPRRPARGRHESGAGPARRRRPSVEPAPEEKPVERAPDERPVVAAGEERLADTAVEEEPAQPASPEEPAAPAAGKKAVVRGDAPPPKKHIPGLSPPPGKEREVASGLPPGKRPRPEPSPRAAAPGPAPDASRPPRPSPARRPRVLHPPAPPTKGWEKCEIELWHGYTTSDFYALAVRPDGETYVAARSPSFRWLRGEPPPETGGAAEAHAALRERLAAEGWEPTDRGSHWYMTRFRRRPTPTLRELARGAEPGAS